MINSATVWSSFVWVALAFTLLCFHICSKAFNVKFGRFSKILDGIERYKIGTVLASAALILVSFLSYTESVFAEIAIENEFGEYVFQHIEVYMNFFTAIGQYPSEVWMWIALSALAFAATVFSTIVCIRKNKNALMIALPMLATIWLTCACNRSAKSFATQVAIDALELEGIYAFPIQAHSTYETLISIAFLILLATFANFIVNRAKRTERESLATELNQLEN